jgi:RNA polymerase sigma-70 factor, ECF subfamily
VKNESLNYEKNKSLIQRFVKAFEMGSTDDLLKLVSDNVTLYSDGGGKVKAATRPIMTPAKVFAFLYGISNKMKTNINYHLETVNGQPALVNYINGALHSTISFYISEDMINEVFITMNPDKLLITGKNYSN